MIRYSSYGGTNYRRNPSAPTKLPRSFEIEYRELLDLRERIRMAEAAAGVNRVPPPLLVRMHPTRHYPLSFRESDHAHRRVEITQPLDRHARRRRLLRGRLTVQWWPLTYSQVFR
jgi:hypothetical protein